MANAAGLIYESIWRNPDWRGLSRGAQALYMQLLSQKEVDCAGVLPLQPTKWAKGCDGLTVDQVMADLDELQDHRFVYYDEDSDEAFIRTYIRNSNVMKVPNMRKSARRAAMLVGSTKIREILAAELRATGDPDCIVTAEEIHPTPDPSKQNSEPLRNPSVTLPEGSGVGMGVGVTHLGNNSRGEARPECPKHPDGNSEDENCRRCMKRRLWDEQNAAALAADELAAKRREREAIQACPDCHGTNTITVGENSAAICSHPRISHA